MHLVRSLAVNRLLSLVMNISFHQLRSSMSLPMMTLKKHRIRITKAFSMPQEPFYQNQATLFSTIIVVSMRILLHFQTAKSTKIVLLPSLIQTMQVVESNLNTSRMEYLMEESRKKIMLVHDEMILRQSVLLNCAFSLLPIIQINQRSEER